MATASTDQHWAVQLSVLDMNGNEVVTDGPIVWASSDATVIMTRNLSADGKAGELKPIAPNQTDAAGNVIPVRCTFTADADLGTGTRTLTQFTEDLFATLGASHEGQTIKVTMGEPIDDPVVAPI